VARTERIERPNILAFIVTQNKVVAVIGANAEIDRSRRVPLILNLRNFEDVPAQGKPDGSLIGSIPGIAFDA
jgi:hypothetical protein